MTEPASASARSRTAAGTDPAVSVVVPVYQTEPWLRECLDSVVSQTYRNLEIILVDDGSEDDGGRICDAYAREDPRIRVVHQPNGGLGYARNTGMDLATGKYIIFLDSDDVWQPDTVESLCRTAEAGQLQVVLFSAKSLFDGVEPFACATYTHSVQNGEVKSGPESLMTAKANREYYAQVCLRFYLLQFLRENHLRFDEGIVHEDESFAFLSCLRAERTVCLGERYYTRRYRPGSIIMTLDPLQSAKGLCTAMETVFRFSRDTELAEREIRLCTNQLKRHTASVFSRYRQCPRGPMRNEIAGIAENTLRMIRKEGKHLPLSFRLQCRFSTGYAAWLVCRALKKGLMCRLLHRKGRLP